MKNPGLMVLVLLAMATVVLAAGGRSITSIESKALLAKNKGIFLLDVRTPEEYRQGRLAGAVLIPITEVERRIGEIPRKRPVIVYCAVGSRSTTVAGILARKGYREVYNMADGIVGWYRNGYPVFR